MELLSCKTVGHSTYAMEEFIRLIKAHGVTCIIDIRSMPYSRRNPQFNRETLRTDLQLNDIDYSYRGDRLGARYSDLQLLFPGGKADFSKVAQLPQFQEGIQLVLDALKKGVRIALMCAEKDPFDCHRFILVSRFLVKNAVKVEHIISEEKLLTQEELEDRLLKKYCHATSQLGLFEQRKTKDEQLEDAYAQRNKEM